MATQTPNINLTKPARTEKVNLAVLTGNLDKIDTEVVERAEIHVGTTKPTDMKSKDLFFKIIG